MLKRTLVYLFLFATATGFAHPQFVQPGAEWWYSFKGGFIYSEGWHHVFFEKDTVVANIACKKLVDETFSRYSSTATTPYIKRVYPIFVRQKGDSVFIYQSPAWVLRWRTNPAPGDSYLVQKDGWNSQNFGRITVDSIRQININGLVVNKIYQHGVFGSGAVSQGSGNVVIYSHIGPSYGVFDYTTCWGSFDCYDSYLCRYKNNMVPLYHFNSPYCDVISNTHHASPDIEITVSPNPCTDEIVFDLGQTTLLKNSRLSITDQSGKLLRVIVGVTASGPDNNRIKVETADWASGLYFYFLTHETGTLAGKFVKN